MSFLSWSNPKEFYKNLEPSTDNKFFVTSSKQNFFNSFDNNHSKKKIKKKKKLSKTKNLISKMKSIHDKLTKEHEMQQNLAGESEDKASDHINDRQQSE